REQRYGGISRDHHPCVPSRRSPVLERERPQEATERARQRAPAVADGKARLAAALLLARVPAVGRGTACVRASRSWGLALGRLGPRNIIVDVLGEHIHWNVSTEHHGIVERPEVVSRS